MSEGIVTNVVIKQRSREAKRMRNKEGKSFQDIATIFNTMGYRTRKGSEYTDKTVWKYVSGSVGNKVKMRRGPKKKPPSHERIKVSDASARLNTVRAMLKLNMSDGEKLAHVELLLN